MSQLALAVALALTSISSAATSSQSGHRNFDVRGCSAVELAASDSIRIVPGPTISVVACGDPRAIAALAMDVHGDTLRVGQRPGTWDDKGALVFITIPSLFAARISGSGGFHVVPVGRREFVDSVSGSGAIVPTNLRVETARFDLSELGLGSIVASDRAGAATIDLGGSGSIDTRALTTPTVKVDLGGSGTVTATTSRTSTIGAGGSDSVRVSGGPRCDVRKGSTATVPCSSPSFL